MCGTCGCGADSKKTLLNLQTGVTTSLAPMHEHDELADQHEHVHADGTRHSHSHDHSHAHSHHTHQHDDDHDQHHHHHHEHAQSYGDRRHFAVVDVEARILAKNDELAARNRAWLAGREVLALNLVSSPGSGKTTLLERTIIGLNGRASLFVIEGDQATANDAERIRNAGAPVVQLNTGTGCHLDAEMVARGLDELKPTSGAVLFIENVGNLVCPALFDLGERAKIVIFSVTEGADKPLKYPHMFRCAELIILNKIDLLPYVDFSVSEALSNIARVNPDVATLQLSARTGEGLEQWLAWISTQSMNMSGDSTVPNRAANAEEVRP